MRSSEWDAASLKASVWQARLGALADWASRGSNGYCLAILAVGVALLARIGLEALGKFYYLPLIPAVMLPALLASRRATALAIVLSILANVLLVPRQSVIDAAVNAVLFALVGVSIGEIARAGRSARDRSARLKSHLIQKDATLQAMMTAAAVVTLDAKSNVISMSEPAARLFQTTSGDAAGRPFHEFVAYFDPPEAGAVAAESSVAEQYWLGRRKDGEIFPLGIQIAYLTSPQQSPEVILTLTDLGLWHRAELRNQALNDQLSQVWRMNSLGEMAAILAHELNQPLTAAAGYLQASQADLGRVGLMADSASRTIDLAKAQILRAGGIIRRARDLLAVDGSSLEPQSLASILDDLDPILQMLGPPAGVTIQVDLQQAEGAVLADRIQLQQAIVNLVRNAVEAVEGQERRDVLVRGRPVSGARYRLAVEDSGPGVPADQRDRLFQPMTTTKANGMGLGLSVTRTIVERHGGRLAIDSSDLGGAAFTFEIERFPAGEEA